MHKKTRKRFLFSALLFLLIITNTHTIYADDDNVQITGIDFSEPILNYIGDEVDASRLEHNYNLFPLLKASAPFPKRYSLKDEGYVTSVKHQNPYGTCWAHAALGSAESRYKKATGIDLNLSELQLAWFAYNNYGIADPLNLVKNDGGKYTYGTGEAIDAVLQLGGNQELSTNVLISGIGISEENNHLPYPSTGEIEYSATLGGYTLHQRNITDKPNNNECYIGDYRVTAVDWYSISDKNEIKTTLMEKGALAISYYHDDNNITDDGDLLGGKSYYCNDKSSQNHAVLLVGWDDDYSASNFIKTPPANGAWICKNSWSKYWGDEGYFYISYYDTSINNTAFGFTIEKITEDNNYDIYQYDGGYSSASYAGNLKSSSVSAANIFKAQDNICIEKIGISTLDADTNYTIDIYVNGTADNPRSGELKYEQKGNITNAGYHTIELNNPVAGGGYSTPVKVSKDHYYSVVVKYSHQNGANVKVPVDITAEIVSSNAKIENSYSNDLSFTGIGDSLSKRSSGNAKIKAYTKLDTEGQEYKEEYYYQNINDDNYTLKETKTKHSLESSISIVPTEIEGFTIKNGTGYSVLSGDNNGSLVLKVYYERNKYDLKFELGEGTFSDGSHDAELKYEAPITKPSDPTRTSYIFAGWDKEIPETMPASDLTISAKWEQNDTTYYVIHHTQMINDLTVYGIEQGNVKTKTATVGTQITASPIDIEGYSYSEEKTLADGNTITKTIERGTSFETATKFDLYYNLNEYSLTLNKEEGIASVSGAGNYYFGETITVDAELEDGYEFNQWTGDITRNDKMFSFEMETSNLELTAKANIIQYTISYNLNNGSASNPTEYNVKTDDFTLTNPTRSGYTFIGWSEAESSDLKETVVITKGSTGDKEFTANWLKNEIDVSSVGLVEGDNAFIDGEKFTVGNNSKIALTDAHKKVLTKYNIANSEQPDVHSQYATDFEVYILEKSGEDLVPVHKEELDSIVTYAGTAIRLTGKKGIRIITSVPTAKKTTLTNGTGIYGYKLYEYGAIMCWADTTNPTITNPTLIKQDSNTYKASTGAYAAAYSLKQNTNVVYKQENGLTKYSTVLTEGSSPWSEEQCKKDFAMRSFIILRPMNATDNSQDLIIYGGTIYRSISYVATQNKNKFAVGSSTYEFIWNLVKYGYPEMYEQEHQTIE